MKLDIKLNILFLSCTWAATFLACNQVPKGALFPNATPIHAANPQSPYKDALKDCLYASTRDAPCSLSTLPFIGQEPEPITFDTILDHTAVSDDWMAWRWKAMFNEYPQAIQNQFFLLMRSVTGIVFANDIHRSFYNPVTATIYLNPHMLDATAMCWNVGSTLIPGTEGGVGKNALGLSFVALYANRKDNQELETKDCLAELLYHELAHAADAISAKDVKLLPKNIIPYDATHPNWKNATSTKASNQFPLSSPLLRQLALVFYGTDDVTPMEKALTADQVADEFSKDPTTDPYGYVINSEDTAMVFQDFMMLYNFGISRIIAFAPAETTTDQYHNVCYHITWGQSRRVADPLLHEKVKLIVEGLLPEFAATVDYSKLPASANTAKGTCFSKPISLDN